MSKLRFAETACARTGVLAGAAALLLAALVAAALCMAAAPSQAYAAGDAYQYTVRVLGGNEGTVAASTVQMQNDATKLGTVKDGIVSLQVDKGEFVKLDTGSVTLNDGSKYYVKGFRLSGQDVLYPKISFDVTEDMDFVVAYGVQGDMVPYTLHFVEYQTGTQLAKPITYYGNVGDKPVASFEYIEGYRPLYRNITGTLAASGNDFTFEYVALAEGETEQGTTTTTTTTVPGTTTTTTTPGTTTTEPGTTTTTTTTVGGGAAGGNAAAGATAGEGEEGEGEEGVAEGNAAANAGANANAGAAPAAAEPATPPATEEILDTDNPLAQSGSTATEGGSGSTAAPLEGATNDQGIPMWVFWVVGIVVAAAAAGFGFFFYRRRRQEEDEALYY